MARQAYKKTFVRARLYNTWKFFKENFRMAKKKVAKKVQKPDMTRQYTGLAAVVIVILLAAWLLLSKPGSKAPSVPSAGNAANDASPACGVFASIPAASQYNSAPAMLIDKSKQYFATFRMAKGGQFVVELYPAKAPITVNSFVFLACKGFFNGVTFHRVLEGFMAQGGDPTGTGNGGPGYQFVNEKNDLAFDKPGVVAMANAGPDTNGSQFFIMFASYGLSENDYTIFGQVIDGMDVINGITLRDPQQNPTFTGDAIESVTVTYK
jgi:cyclophilin family peptidyl-prolyl cis-trans isomerase